MIDIMLVFIAVMLFFVTAALCGIGYEIKQVRNVLTEIKNRIYYIKKWY